MADIKTIDVGGCDDDDGKRGKRGKRGHRGHRGHAGTDGAAGADGPPGPAGPAGPAGASGGGGLLKFSGEIAPAGDGGLEVASFLEDWGTGVGFTAIISLDPSYPVAVEHNLRNMATNLLNGFIVPPGGLVVIQLLQNGGVVPGFEITYTPDPPFNQGIQTVVAGPAPFLPEDTIDVRVLTSGPITLPIDASVTIGIE